MSIEAMKQALEAFDVLMMNDYSGYECGKRETHKIDEAITALSQAIEEAEKQEPVAWMEIKLSKDADGLLREKFFFNQDGDGVPVYTAPIKREWVLLKEDEQSKDLQNTAPPKREWVGLTDEEFVAVLNETGKQAEEMSELESVVALWEAIEAKLKEKNT